MVERLHTYNVVKVAGYGIMRYVGVSSLKRFINCAVQLHRSHPSLY